MISEDGSANTYDLDIPYDHMLNFVGMARTHTDSENWQIRYVPVKVDTSYYDILFDNANMLGRSAVIELGSNYENLGGAILTFAITGTNNKKWFPRVNIKFLEVPE